jgi:hypothetical protein
MITKKISVLALCCLAFFSSCEKDSNNQDEIDRLEKELIAEKSKTVVDIRKEGNDLILTYSNGSSQKLLYTEALKGNIGQNGVGISSISYNEQTGILKITLTNGEVSEFKIIDNGQDWKAILVGDTNGRLFIQEVLLGSVPIIKAEYNDSYQLTYLESNRAVDMQTRKAFDIKKSYASGSIDKYTIKKYALEEKVNYTSTWVRDDSYTEVVFTQDKGQYYKESNGDGTYTLYIFYNTSWLNGSNRYHYRKYKSKAIVISSGSPDYGNYEIVRKKNDTEFHYYRDFYSWYVNNEDAFFLDEIVTINGKVSAGELEATEVVDVDADGQGRVTKMYKATAEGGQPTKYISYEYNSLGLVNTTKSYVKNTQGAWVAEGTYETYNYNVDNRLTSTVRTYADGSTKEVQRAVYDKNGNPTEIWVWQPAVRDYRSERNPSTGQWGYSAIIRTAGLYKAVTIEYDYSFKNFLGNTLVAMVPELEGYKVVNAIKRVTTPNSYSFANIEYKNFNEFGYPRLMSMDAAYIESDDTFSINYEVALNYKVKAK